MAWCLLESRADEGMWIPMLLQKYGIEAMQAKGFRLTAEDVYAINWASMKDAVVGLGREGSPFHHFCTGGIISADGLVVTNHHCSVDMIQKHSSLEHNYLRDGFWAMSREEELTNPGITASILVRMEDVTGEVLAAVTDGTTEERRKQVIDSVSRVLEKRAVEGTELAANIKPYFNGNQYYMSVFRIFKDVRLVAAPPAAIGNFGGDTDNWTWPRHTGDFSVLRIYADEHNAPAPYSAQNRPYHPDYFSKISVAGLMDGDFTMVFGYPGTTNEYVTSYAVEQMLETENPHKISIRTAKLNIIKAAMNRSDLLRIKYTSKAASVANSWKKWQGESKGLKRFHTVERKRTEEETFQSWAADKPRYAGLLGRYKTLYEQRRPLMLASVYAGEAGLQGAEIIGFARAASTFAQQCAKVAPDSLPSLRDAFMRRAKAFFKDYDSGVDCTILTELLQLYTENVPVKWMPEAIAGCRGTEKPGVFAVDLFRKSIFTDSTRCYAFIENAGRKAREKVRKDPACALANALFEFRRKNISEPLGRINREIAELDRVWVAAWMEMQPERHFYPDANSTLRVAYGTVGGYAPVDAVQYASHTTLKGIMEKDNPAIYDYNIPQKLRDLNASRDFGRFAENGEMPVCFVANNHTTGGNSGSPVLNANGELVGLNFDRAWDGVMSDLQYDPDICRNIAVDIRYVLFLIEKLGGAGYLLNEMEIVR